MKRLFGTDGMRGEAGIFPLDPATIHVVGLSLARQLAKKSGPAPLIVIGRDTRESGPWIEQELIAGLRAAGARIESAGVITTPGVAYLAGVLSAAAGVVISASHNPFQDNGIKIFAPTGRKLDEELEKLIEQDIATLQLDQAKAQASVSELTPETSFAEGRAQALCHLYLESFKSEFPALSLKGLKLVVDCANGAASALAPGLFKEFGARLVAINCDPDGRNINRGCGSLHMEELRARVLSEKADLGIAFDGDADRSLFVDSAGALVDGDMTLLVIANYLKSRNELPHDLVVATVMSNIGLEIALKRLGATLLRTDVGDKYVLEELLRTGAAIGGEQSGHIIFPKRSLAGDGMLTALCLMQALAGMGKPLREIAGKMERFPQVLINVRVREKLPFEEIPEIANAAARIRADLGSGGRLLLRYSGTEALARVMIEGPTEAGIQLQAESLASVIADVIGA